MGCVGLVPELCFTCSAIGAIRTWFDDEIFSTIIQGIEVTSRNLSIDRDLFSYAASYVNHVTCEPWVVHVSLYN